MESDASSMEYEIWNQEYGPWNTEFGVRVDAILILPKNAAVPLQGSTGERVQKCTIRPQVPLSPDTPRINPRKKQK